MDELLDKHDSFNLHENIKSQGAKKKKGRPVVTLLYSQGNITTTLKEKLSTWEKYEHDLCNDERDDQYGIESAAEGPDILPDEVEYARNIFIKMQKLVKVESCGCTIV